jgi:mono/diheme cytochrome c family protein
VFAGFPRWLAASFIIIPMIALLYAGFSPNGPSCGTSGQLKINPVTGDVEACQGGAAVFFTQGEATFKSICAACHGADGTGGVGPSMVGGAVLQTFSSCTDHIAWVTTGSNNWPDPTYGDTKKPVLGYSGAAMPGFGGTLTDQEIAAVVLYERVAFGGADPVTEAANCGLTTAGG